MNEEENISVIVNYLDPDIKRAILWEQNKYKQRLRNITK